MSIDRTARIHSSALIGEGVTIGPNVIVGEKSIIGQGSVVMAHAVIGPWTTIGERNVIHYGAIIGHDPQDFGYHGEECYLHVGNGNVFREYVTIHRGNREGTSTVIGNDNFFMAQSHVAHNCIVGNNVILAGGALLAGHVEVADRAIISGNCVVHQFCRIGRYAMMRGLSRSSRDIPPFCIMDGTHTVRALNLVGLRRNGFDQKRIRVLKETFKILFTRGLAMHSAIAEVERSIPMTDDVRELLDFIRTSRRGVCFGRGSSGPDEE